MTKTTTNVKKNWVLRAMVLVLAFTLLTTCLLSSTLAKYIAGASGDHHARVAYWGISASATGVLFSDVYKVEDGTHNGHHNGISVKSETGNLLLAPGTSNDKIFDENNNKLDPFMLKISSISDKNPEVAYEIVFKDVEFDLAGWEILDDQGQPVEDYYPLTWYVNGEVIAWEDLQTAFRALGTSCHDAGTPVEEAISNTYPDLFNADGECEIRWAWSFMDGTDDTEKAERDEKDTALGNREVPPTIDIGFTLSIEQID